MEKNKKISLAILNLNEIVSLRIILPKLLKYRYLVDEIIARVDDYIVLRSELESTYLDILSRGERISGNTKCAVLKDLITNKLLVAKAEIDSILVEDGQVDQELNSRMALIINQVGSKDEI